MKVTILPKAHSAAVSMMAKGCIVEPEVTTHQV